MVLVVKIFRTTIGSPLFFFIHFVGFKNRIKVLKRIREVIFPQLLHLCVIGRMSSINYANQWLQQEGPFPHFTLFKRHITCTIYQLCKSMVNRRWDIPSFCFMLRHRTCIGNETKETTT